MALYYINKIDVDLTPMRSTKTVKSINVVGDAGSSFNVRISRSSDSRAYNFVTKAFESTETSQSRLKNQKPGSFNVSFPAASSGDTYTISFTANSNTGTEFSFGRNKLYYSFDLTQSADPATITFIAAVT